MKQRDDLAGTGQQQSQTPRMIKVPITIEPQAEGGYAVRSPALPELITEGATIEDASAHVPDAVAAVLELYEDLGKPLPAGMIQEVGPISYEALLSKP
jgi:antitoxin HicB